MRGSIEFDCSSLIGRAAAGLERPLVSNGNGRLKNPINQIRPFNQTYAALQRECRLLRCTNRKKP
jgi:hypothetical protein